MTWRGRTRCAAPVVMSFDCLLAAAIPPVSVLDEHGVALRHWLDKGSGAAGCGASQAARCLHNELGCHGAIRVNDFSLPAQHLPFGPFSMQIEFGQIYVSKPMYTEADGETAVLFPKEARLRNLTYAAPL